MSRSSTLGNSNYLLDLYEAGLAIASYTSGLAKRDLENDTIRFQAVKYEIVVMGEACRRLTSNFRDNHTKIPWKDLVGMRNIIVHRYDDIDIDLVWDAIQTSVPDLLN